MTARNSSRDAIIDELSRYGVQPSTTGHGGLHPYVEFVTGNGIRVRIPHTTNGREGHGRRLGNYRAMVRRHMQRLGIKPLAPEIPVKSRQIDLNLTAAPPRPVRVAPPAPVEQPRIILASTPQSEKQEPTMAKENIRTKMSRVQVIACSKWLEERSAEVDGKRSYAEGWHDARIAEAMNAADPSAAHKMDGSHVAALRRELYPEWKLSLGPRNTNNTGGRLNQRMAALEARVQALEDAATAPRQAGNGYAQASMADIMSRRAGSNA